MALLAVTTEPGVHTNTAAASGNEADPAAGNNAASTTTRVPVPVTREPQQRTDGCTQRGTPGDDVLRGGPGVDVLCGLGGNDVGFAGNDRLLGGAGNDNLKGGNGHDELLGGAGDDRLDGGRGRDTLAGERGNDYLNGSYGNDFLVGGQGKDRTLGGPGKDRMRRDKQDATLGGPGKGPMHHRRHRQRLPVRGGVLAAALAVVLSAAGAGQIVDAQAQIACAPITRALSNGASTADGALTVLVDGSGAFSDATFNPPGSTGPADTTNISKLYLSRFLAGECVFVDSEVPGQTVTTHFDVAQLAIELTQTLGPVTARTSTLTQTYRISNNDSKPLSFAVVRHVDGDLLFDGNKIDGAAASLGGVELSQFDAGDAPPAETALAISGSLGTSSPARWTIQPAPYGQAIEGAGQIPDADNGVASPSPLDATLSQQWNAQDVAPNDTVVFTTVTRFGTPPNQHLLSVSKTGDGTVTSVPPGIACGSTCSAPFDEGGTVSVAAVPDPGWAFAGWEGACTGTGAYAVAMSGARSVTAHFNPPPPVPAQNVNASPVSGIVLVREPGTGRVHPADGGRPALGRHSIGSTNGRIQLTAARVGGVLETSQFYEGLFTYLQDTAAALPEVRLEGGDFSCLETAFSWQATKKPVRRVWGSGKGKYRTRGRYSSATVRGTRWKTEDRCDGTLTTVEEGVVAVRDFVRQADVVLREVRATSPSRSHAASRAPGVRSSGPRGTTPCAGRPSATCYAAWAATTSSWAWAGTTGSTAARRTTGWTAESATTCSTAAMGATGSMAAPVATI